MMTTSTLDTRAVVTRPTAAPATRRTRGRGLRVLWGTLGWAGSLTLFFPVAYMVLKSLQTEKVAASATPQFLFEPTLEHYAAAFDQGIWPYAINSFLVTAVSTLLVIALALPAAWALSVRAIANPQDSLFFFISTKMMPIAAGIIPVYIVATNLGWLNTVHVLVIMHLGMNLPLGIWMLRSFMQEIPLEVIEAAQVDGAKTWRIGWSVVLPLMRPGIASTALLCAVFSWNEYFYAANLTSSTSTLPLYLQKFLSFGELYTAQVAAVATIVSIPVVIAGWFAQKSLVRGLLFGAVK
ncbi:carbohydrate ABC transporter permease [Microbacterium sp. XT11]|uniref:carbohydrate ABC transporter permease n=1 Tax=Microbacterium sp. XT11 TaxID=367477 RepID=UPI000B1A3DC9|nr:carbohydrate ABC transporter permease [Microbacterium sp. XT11]